MGQKRPNIVLKLSLRTYNLNMKESMLLLLLQKSVVETLTRLSVNGKPKLMTLQLKLRPAKRNAAIITVNSSALKLLGMKPLSNWMMVDDLFMNLISNADVLKLKRKNFKLLLRKL